MRIFAIICFYITLAASGLFGSGSSNKSVAKDLIKGAVAKREYADMFQQVLPIRDLRSIVLDYLDQWEPLVSVSLENASNIWFLSNNSCLIAQNKKVDASLNTGQTGFLDRYTLDTGSFVHQKTLRPKDFESGSSYRTGTLVSANGKFLLAGSGYTDGQLYQIEQDTISKIQDIAKGIEITAATFSPDSQWLAYCSLLDGKVHIYRQKDGAFEFVQAIDHLKKAGNYFQIEFSADSNLLAITYDTKKIKIFVLHNGRYVLEQTLRDHKEEVFACAFSPDGNYLVTSSAQRVLLYQREKSGRGVGSNIRDSQKFLFKHMLVPPGEHKSIAALAFSPCGNYLATGDYHGKAVDMWHVKPDNFVWQQAIAAQLSCISRLQFSADGSYVTAAGVGTPQVWVNTKKNLEQEIFDAHKSVTMQTAGTAQETGNLLQSTKNAQKDAANATVSKQLLSDNALLKNYICDKQVQQVIVSYLGFEEYQLLPNAIENSVVAFDDMNKLYVGGCRKIMYRPEVNTADSKKNEAAPNMLTWQRNNGRFRLIERAKFPCDISSLQVNTSFRAVGCQQGIYTCASQTGNYKPFFQSDRSIVSMAMSADGSYWAAVSKHTDAYTKLHCFAYDVTEKSYLQQDIPFHSRTTKFYTSPRIVVISPDGLTACVISVDRDIILLKNLDNCFEPYAIFKYLQASCAAFSPCGNVVAIGTADKVIVLQKGKDIFKRHELPITGYFVQEIAFSPDGAYLCVGVNLKTCIDNYVAALPKSVPVLQIWQVNATHIGQSVLCKTFPVKSEINSLAFSPNGTYIAAGLGDGSVQVWNNQQKEVGSFR